MRFVTPQDYDTLNKYAEKCILRNILTFKGRFLSLF